MIDRLGMTEEQIVNEIVTMRKWDDFLRRKIAPETYTEYMNEFMRREAEEVLKTLGADDDVIKEAIAYAEEIWKNS